MKKTQYLFCIILSHLGAALMAQSQIDTAHIMFYADSDSTYEILDEAGQEVAAKVYHKFITKSDDGKIKQISFWIQKENFEFCLNKYTVDTMEVSQLKSIKVKSIRDMLEVVDEREEKIPFSYLDPSSAFSKIYLIEKIDDKKAVKYEVHCQYYIE